MKVLNDMEVQLVSGGESLATQIDGMTHLEAVDDFFAALNEFGGDLGIWIYNYTHGC